MAKSLMELKEKQRVEADWIIPNLLKRGNTAFMIGTPKKACKSWMLLELAWSLSEGKEIWGIKRHPSLDDSPASYLLMPERAMRTVYFTQEDTEDDIHDRCMAHFNAGRIPNDRLWVVPKDLRIAFDTTGGLNTIQEELDGVGDKAGKIDLVIFDPMRRFHRGDENDSGIINRLWESLDKIHRRYGCATMFSHHTVKPPTAKENNFDPTSPFVGRGSGDIYGGGDSFMTIVPGKGDEHGRVVGMYFESKRGRQLEPAQLKVHFKTGKVEWLGRGFERKEKDDD